MATRITINIIGHAQCGETSLELRDDDRGVDRHDGHARWAVPGRRGAVGTARIRGLASGPVLACAVGVGGVPGMTLADCRIGARCRTARWDPDAEVSVAEAMDFWAFAAGAANV